MPSTAHQPIHSQLLTAGTWVQDFSPLVLVPPTPGAELTFWSMLPKAADSFEPSKKEWVEEELVPITITLTKSGGIGATDAENVQFNANEVAKAGIRPGMLLINATDTTKLEVIQIASMGAAAGQLNLVRDYGTLLGAGEVHAKDAVFKVLPAHEFEGSRVNFDDNFPYRDRNLAENYYSLCTEHTVVSGSDLVREYRGSTPDNWSYQVKGIVQAMERKYDYLVLRSAKVARSGSARGSMGGLLWFAMKTTGAAGVSYRTTPATFDYELFDDLCLALYNRTGLENLDLVLAVPPNGMQVIPYIHESAMRMEYARENIRGYFANSLITTITGQRIPVVMSSNLPSDSLILMNRAALRVHFLRTRALVVYNKPLGEGMDDFVAQRWLSELTLECQRPLDNMIFYKGLEFKRPAS